MILARANYNMEYKSQNYMFMTPEKVKNESGYLSFSDNEFKSNLVVFQFM